MLRSYFPTEGSPTGYTGGYWDTFDPSGRRVEDADVFTSDDLVSTTLLSGQVPAPAALEMLGPRSDRLTELLTQIGEHRDLAAEAGGRRHTPRPLLGPAPPLSAVGNRLAADWSTVTGP